LYFADKYGRDIGTSMVSYLVISLFNNSEKELKKASEENKKIWDKQQEEKEKQTQKMKEKEEQIFTQGKVKKLQSFVKCKKFILHTQKKKEEKSSVTTLERKLKRTQTVLKPSNFPK